MNKRLATSPWAVSKVEYGKRPIVLNIDMQKFFTEEDSPFKAAKMPGFQLVRRGVAGTKKLMDAARLKNVQIVHTATGFRKDGKDKGLWKMPAFTDACLLGTKWVEKCPELEPKEEDIVFIRKMPDAFFGSELLNVMIVNEFDTLIITGLNTSGCIRATTISSFEYGFSTILPEDCIGDLVGEEAHWGNLSDINGRYANVVSLDDVLKYFDGLPKQR